MTRPEYYEIMKILRETQPKSSPPDDHYGTGLNVQWEMMRERLADYCCGVVEPLRKGMKT